MNLPQFTESRVCTGRRHCRACRSRSRAGEAFRAQMARVYVTPPDWACPHGLEWTGVAARDGIVAVTLATDAWAQLRELTFDNKRRYCERHGYAFVGATRLRDATRPPSWSKVPLVREQLEAEGTNWVWWSDADSIVRRPAIPLERYIDEDADLICAADENGINFGAFLLRKCDAAFSFLDAVWARAEFTDHKWWEQAAVHALVREGRQRVRVKVIPQAEFNCYPEAPEAKDAFLVHVPARSLRSRLKMLAQYAPPEPSRGLGDAFAKLTKAFGVKPCSKCEKKRGQWNAAVPFAQDVNLYVFGGLGDWTAASGPLRDLKLAHPKASIRIRGGFVHLFRGCPWVESLERAPAVKMRDAQLRPDECPLNVGTGHYGAGNVHLQELIARDLRAATGLDFPTTKLGGDLRLTDEEKSWRPPWATDKPLCIINGGRKSDFELKLAHTGELQRFVDMTRDRFTHVQVGGRDHYHPRLDGVFDFVRQHGPESKWEDFRWTMRAVYRAALVISPVSWPMHLAAALELPEGHHRRCIVVGGGRENPKLTAYPGHTYLSTIGELDCCRERACWKMRVKECTRPVETGRDGERTGECMRLLTAERMLAAIDN